MATILQFPLFHSSFGPETLSTLGEAYDRVLANMSEEELRNFVCELMAGRILAAAMKGERDPEQLCKVALRRIAAAG